MITITNTPSFLCSWNNGEKVEVHTRKSLEEHYGDTNLFDEDEDCEKWYPSDDFHGEEPFDNLSSLLNFIGRRFDGFDRYYSLSCIFTCDNMTIQRIK